MRGLNLEFCPSQAEAQLLITQLTSPDPFPPLIKKVKGCGYTRLVIWEVIN